MASQAWLEFSLRRSGRLGLEVLERASRRDVDWTGIRASQTSATEVGTRSYRSELRDAFANITSFMAQTSHHCQVREDLLTFVVHTLHPVLARDEDFYIEVSPGMYSVSASVPDSQPQTHLVSIQPGESVVLTFNF
uniref:A-kinase interacting protein 1 n=1 Tax=Poecilia reticulata TaxID=8081 RepID=A0A3P9N911_POERE